MDFELSEELTAVRDLAREFAEKEIAPTAAKDDKEHNFRKDLLLKMGELGFFGSVIPEKYGGNGLGFLAMVLITEEIARVHSACVWRSTCRSTALALLQFGNGGQKEMDSSAVAGSSSVVLLSPSLMPVQMYRQ
jgi:glutaryl-CoA dehydrogenase (non-decarboxylating)